VQEGLATWELPRSIALKWLAKQAHESAQTQRHRIILVRQFSRFLSRRGYSAYVPDSTLAARNRSSFVPRMLTDEELRKVFQAVDALKPTAHSPLRHLIMPEVFRLLYGCGFRVSEVLKLRVRDVDLNQGTITVRQGKFRKDRLVPPALPLVNRLRKYSAHFENRPPDAVFFPTEWRALQHSHRLQAVSSTALPVWNFSRRPRQGPRSTTHVTNSLFVPYDAGIKMVRIWMPNFRSWPLTLGIRIFRDSALPSSHGRTFPRNYLPSRRGLGDVIPRRIEP
jgi:integrase